MILCAGLVVWQQRRSDVQVPFKEQFFGHPSFLRIYLTHIYLNWKVLLEFDGYSTYIFAWWFADVI